MKIWKLIKPLIVIGLAVVGYFQEIVFKWFGWNKDASDAIFLLIIISCIIVYGKDIAVGIRSLFPGEE